MRQRVYALFLYLLVGVSHRQMTTPGVARFQRRVRMVRINIQPVTGTVAQTGIRIIMGIDVTRKHNQQRVVHRGIISTQPVTGTVVRKDIHIITTAVVGANREGQQYRPQHTTQVAVSVREAFRYTRIAGVRMKSATRIIKRVCYPGVGRF